MSRAQQTPYLTYGLDKDGNLMHIDSVSTGLSCKCFCPCCKRELVAKNQGSHNIHHFAHGNGSNCAGAIESVLHKMAKDILKEHKLIMLPANQQDKKQISFSKVESEIYDNKLSLRPDCIGYTENGKIIWIEFKHTHEVDAQKACKIISAKIDCIELDLNSCEPDPLKVRRFIEESNKCRKWIFNNEIPQNISFIKQGNYRQPKLRHIAIDKQSTIVNLYNHEEIELNECTYFCVACGKEVYINVDNVGNYSFVHINNDVSCGYDAYLHEAAKKILYWRFNSQSKFEVYIPQLHFCKNKSDCMLFDKSLCSVSLPTPYNLKEHGYDICEIESTFSNGKNLPDAILKSSKDYCDPIIIDINANTHFSSYMNQTNRIIRIKLINEDDLLRLYQGPLHSSNYIFNNFKQPSNLKTTSYWKINRKVLKFILLSDGKYYWGLDNCMKTKRKNAIYELIITKGILSNKSMIQYFVLYFYNKQKDLCTCEICKFLMDEDCLCSKTNGTPSKPLQTMPIKCPYFSMDSYIKSTLEYECQNLEFIENDLINI